MLVFVGPDEISLFVVVRRHRGEGVPSLLVPYPAALLLVRLA